MISFWLLLVPFALVIIAAVYDVASRIIPNWIPIALLTWAVATAGVGLHPEGWLGLLKGFGLAFAIGLVLFAARSLDGGDAKLFAALGAVLGLERTVGLLIGTAVACCVLALVAIVRKQRKFPYAPAIAFGFLIILVVGGYRNISR
jgi:prepilin peptidase CpaA